MVTKMLNSGLIQKLADLQIAGRTMSTGEVRWTYCSDGSCSGDCVGGCDGTPAGGMNP